MGAVAGAVAGAEFYRGTRADLRRLIGKIEAYSPADAKSEMEAAYEASLRLIDVWRAPPLPVVCLIGSGKPTQVSFLYREPWPKAMAEEPCVTRYEDGDGTVPLRSAEAVCEAWARQRRCASPLPTVHATQYRGRDAECVAVHYLHCRSAAMESADAPRGAEHCVDLHSKILHKLPAIDLVQSLAVNPRAFEPGYAISLDEVHELSQLLAWLHNSAAQRLPTTAQLLPALTAWADAGAPPPAASSWNPFGTAAAAAAASEATAATASSTAATAAAAAVVAAAGSAPWALSQPPSASPQPPSASPLPMQPSRAWAAQFAATVGSLRSRHPYERALTAMQALHAVTVERVRRVGTASAAATEPPYDAMDASAMSYGAAGGDPAGGAGDAGGVRIEGSGSNGGGAGGGDGSGVGGGVVVSSGGGDVEEVHAAMAAAARATTDATPSTAPSAVPPAMLAALDAVEASLAALQQPMRTVTSTLDEAAASCTAPPAARATPRRAHESATPLGRAPRPTHGARNGARGRTMAAESRDTAATSSRSHDRPATSAVAGASWGGDEWVGRGDEWAAPTVGGDVIGALGLPDSFDAFERATALSHVRSCAEDEHASAQQRQRVMCALHAALASQEPALRQMAEQLHWCHIHWERLRRRLEQPEPPPALTSAIGVPGVDRVPPEEYESSLYGKMEDDDLR